MAKRTQTLIDETEQLTLLVCALIDASAAPETIEKARAVRDAKLAEVRSRPDGRRYDTGLYA